MEVEIGKMKKILLIVGLPLLMISIVGVATACSSSSAPQAANNLIVNANTVMSGPCVLTSQFKTGDTIVWRIKVYDPTTGNAMDNKALKSVLISFADQKLVTTYGGHPGGADATPTDYFWGICWPVPTDYPTGSLNYHVTATSNDGRVGEFTEFDVAPSLVTIVQ
jgi:hypothetical protein